MKSTKFKSYYNNGRAEEITKITLDDDEWLLFLRNLANFRATNVETDQEITDKDVEYIDTNRCIPLCPNIDFLKRFNADTKYLSIVSENYGDIHLRLWFAEKSVFTTLNIVMEEIFPGALAEEVLEQFWMFWNNLPMEAQTVGNRVIAKREQGFGIGHLAAWMQERLGGEEPKIAWQKFLFYMRPAMYAHELYIVWMKSGLIKNENGRILPIKPKSII